MSLSTAALRRMHDALSGYVDRGELPGYVALVARHGEVHVDRSGYGPDAIFRLGSMSKPIAAVAALILVEEGAIRLDDPVDGLLPELAGLRVLRSLASPLDDTVPAARSITVRDLLTFTLGTGMVLAPPGTYPIQDAMQKTLYDVWSGPTNDGDDYLRRLASLPLVHQPGEAWMYHTGSDVLGILVARASGRSFGEFLAERVFSPLGMRDSGFWVPPERIHRLPIAYAPGDDAGALEVHDPAAGGRFSRPPGLESGGGGMVATLYDFLTFARMLLDHGAGPGGPLLAPATVEAMTSDQLSPEVKARTTWNDGWLPIDGWGFGVGVVTQHRAAALSPGAYGWNGGFGTTWRSDPAKGSIVVFMTQVAGTKGILPAFGDFIALASAAVDS